ncbi:MAG: DUF4350 domain-containing protein [Bradymonadaceae bacterium]|nr:DUF4350 domain-containing protein [Lujinxingiaceae bacterium]
MSAWSATRLASVLLALVCAFPALVGAQEPGADYDPVNADWSGLRQLVELARVEGIELVHTTELDYGRLGLEDAVVIVHPQGELDVSNLANFVIAGGRILLADDFGKSEAFLSRLAVSRITMAAANLPHLNHVRDNPALPIFEPRGRHPLLVDVERLVANHPAVLFNVGGPVVAFSEGGGLVYDMTLADGKVVVLADPSMLINHMLNVADNAQFARNALRYICAERSTCRVHLLVESWQERGQFEGRALPSGETEISRRIQDVNDYVSSLTEGIPLAELLYYLSILLVGGLAAYLITVFPVRRPRAYSRYITQALENVPAPQTEFDWNMSRFGQGASEVNYALPVAILKELFEELFLTRMGLWPSRSTDRPGVDVLGERFAASFLKESSEAERRKLESEVIDLLATFAQIPTRHRVFLDSDAYFSERDLLRIYRRTMRILKLMGLEEEYERRTRSLA